MELKPGNRLQSQTDATCIAVVRAPRGDVDLQCGGHPMVLFGSEDTQTPVPGLDDGAQVGKRYVDEDIGLEVLCTTAGSHTLAVADRPLAIKDAKPLPSSD